MKPFSVLRAKASRSATGEGAHFETDMRAASGAAAARRPNNVIQFHPGQRDDSDLSSLPAGIAQPEAYMRTRFPGALSPAEGRVFSSDGRVITGILSDYKIAACLGPEGSPEEPTVFCPELGEFFRYASSSGVYEAVGEAAVEKQVADLLFACAIDSGTPEPDRIRRLAKRRIVNPVVKALQASSTLSLSSFSRQPHQIHVGNGILDLQNLRLDPHSPASPTRFALPIDWDSEAEHPQGFFRFLQDMFPDPDDVTLAIRVIAMALLGNPFQRVVLFTGASSCGKSTLVKLILRLVGPEAYGQLRLEHAESRFESEAWIGKLLLAQLDASSRALQKNMHILKAISGQDTFSAEVKGVRTRIHFRPTALPVITANGDPKIRLDQDEDAWSRRLIILRGTRPPRTVNVPAFEDHLVATEGAGILRVVAEEARHLLQTGAIPLTQKQQGRTRLFLEASDPVSEFVRCHVEPSKGKQLYTADAYAAARAVLHKQGARVGSEAAIARDFNAAMREVYETNRSNSLPPRPGYSTKGWRNFHLVDLG